MEKEISVKNTKSEILQAYEDVLKKLEEQKVPDTKAAIEAQQKQKTVEKADSNTFEGIVKDIAGLKVTINATLEKLENSLLKEFRKLTEIKEAIETETKRLDDLYQISVNANSLEALILAQKEKKSQFEAEMNEARKASELEVKESREKWDKEKQKIELEVKELKEITAKNRKREEEEYNYNLQLKRKKEEDAYLEKKQSLEKAITEKQKEWENKEKEYLELKSAVEGYPQKLEEAVSKAKEEITKNLTSKFKFEKDLNEKEIEGNTKLYKQTIQNLEAKIKEQSLLIEQLTKKADLSSEQVKEIAMKAVEGAGSQRFHWEKENKDKNQG